MAIATITLHATGKKISAELKPNGLGVIHFRPHANYQGEFGFDWVRDEIDPTPYNGIVGKYISKRDKKSKKVEKVFEPNEKNYKDLLKEYKTFKHPINTNDDYYIPYLTLLPNAEAKFTLHLDIKSYINEYHFKYDDTLFELSKTDLSEKEAGKYQTDFSIKCIKEFSKNQYVSIEGDGKLIGRIMVLANHIQKKIKVVFTEVLLHKDCYEFTDSSFQNKIKNGLNNILKQFYMEADVKFEAPLNNYLSKIQDIELKKFIRLNKYLKSEYKNEYFNREDFGILFNYIDKLFRKIKHFDVYKDYYKIFCFKREAKKKRNGIFIHTLGVAEDKSDICFIFDDFKTDDETIAHELLHCLGLDHTFENSSPYTFRKYHTDNVMDYVGEGEEKCFEKTNTSSFWQWKKINGKNITNNEK